jgi:glycosyltransferase involved in cell wall biosynthesis
MKTICIVGGAPGSLVNFRGELILRFVKSGNRVYALAGIASEKEKKDIEALGVTFVEVPISRTSTNPLEDIKTYRFYKHFFNKVSPDIVLSYTIKPVIWSGLALLKLPKVKFYALVTGLGYAFKGQSIKQKLLRKIVSHLYRKSLSRAEKVIFQNSDDLSFFTDTKICSKSKTTTVSGSGVPIDQFAYKHLPERPTIFLMIARLLKEKGIIEYLKAAKIVKKSYPEVSFQVLGPLDPSPDGLSKEDLGHLNNRGVVEYLGKTIDVRPYLANCHIFVLPSFYGEGLPRTILEAMATGRAVLTTDSVGCREPIVEGENGCLVPVKDSKSLAEKMIWFIEHPEQLKEMGLKGRKMAEDKFDVHKVNKEMLRIMEIE